MERAMLRFAILSLPIGAARLRHLCMAAHLSGVLQNIIDSSGHVVWHRECFKSADVIRHVHNVISARPLADDVLLVALSCVCLMCENEDGARRVMNTVGPREWWDCMSSVVHAAAPRVRQEQWAGALRSALLVLNYCAMGLDTAEFPAFANVLRKKETLLVAFAALLEDNECVVAFREAAVCRLFALFIQLLSFSCYEKSTRVGAAIVQFFFQQDVFPVLARWFCRWTLHGSAVVVTCLLMLSLALALGPPIENTLRVGVYLKAAIVVEDYRNCEIVLRYVQHWKMLSKNYGVLGDVEREFIAAMLPSPLELRRDFLEEPPGVAAMDCCAWCGRTLANNIKQVCSRCEETAYCSETCQRRHWVRHKAVCVFPSS